MTTPTLSVSADHLEYIGTHDTPAAREFVDLDLGLLRCGLCQAAGRITVASYRRANSSANLRYTCIACASKSQAHLEMLDPFFLPKIIGSFDPESPARCIDARTGITPTQKRAPEYDPKRPNWNAQAQEVTALTAALRKVSRIHIGKEQVVFHLNRGGTVKIPRPGYISIREVE